MATTILVTGGAGFIGSHVCKALAEAGFRPVAYDNLSHGHRWAVRWGPLEVGDLADAERLDLCLGRHRPEAVIHLAGYTAAGESVRDPATYYENNVTPFLVLLEAMRRHGVDRMVFSSSAAVYGNPARSPITEDAPIQPVNPYGQTKAMCEQILRDYAAAYGIRSLSLRYFNAAGADPKGELGESHDPETHLIPLVLEAAAGLRSHVEIYGDGYPTRDGTCVRDYIHVADLAQAHVLALGRTAGEIGALAYNLGNGRGFTVLEVLSAAEKVTGRSIPVRRASARPGDPAVLVADPTLAMTDLGWRRPFESIDIQLAHAWHWLRHHKRGALVVPPMLATSVPFYSQRP